MDIARGEIAEAQLDAFINRRARERIRENGRTASRAIFLPTPSVARSAAVLWGELSGSTTRGRGRSRWQFAPE